MRIDIYKSATNMTKYLSVPAGTDVENMSFPNDFDPDLVELQVVKNTLEIKLGHHYAGFDSADIINQIDAKGFAVNSATIKTTLASK